MPSHRGKSHDDMRLRNSERTSAKQRFDFEFTLVPPSASVDSESVKASGEPKGTNMRAREPAPTVTAGRSECAPANERANNAGREVSAPVAMRSTEAKPAGAAAAGVNGDARGNDGDVGGGDANSYGEVEDK